MHLTLWMLGVVTEYTKHLTSAQRARSHLVPKVNIGFMPMLMLSEAVQKEKKHKVSNWLSNVSYAWITISNLLTLANISHFKLLVILDSNKYTDWVYFYCYL